MENTPDQNEAIDGSQREKELQHTQPQELVNSSTRRQFLIKLRDYTFAAVTAATFSTETPFVAPLRLIADQLRGSRLTEKQIAQIVRTYSPTEPIQLGNKYFQQIGVAHTRESYYAHRQEIRSVVGDSPKFVFLEYFDDEIAKNAVPTSSEPIDVPTNSRNVDDGSKSFYSGIGKIAADAGKDIIVVNPQNLYSEVVDTIGILGLTGAVLFKDWGPKEKEGSKGKLSRRNLFTTIATVTASGVAYGVGVPRLIENTTRLDLMKELQRSLQKIGILSNELSPEEQAEILKWYEKDWRDVSSAVGVMAAIKKYSNEITSENPNPMFQGEKHSAIVNYLRDENLRIVKDKSYTHLNFAGNRTVRRFHFNQTANVWELVDVFMY